jgi:hypothetical protein
MFKFVPGEKIFVVLDEKDKVCPLCGAPKRPPVDDTALLRNIFSLQNHLGALL